jgi:hypothetical protein
LYLIFLFSSRPDEILSCWGFNSGTGFAATSLPACGDPGSPEATIAAVIDESIPEDWEGSVDWIVRELGSGW